jgi:phosphoadenosine phosphosulfate reductase
MLRYTDITGLQIDKVQTAIDRLKAFEPPDGYYLAFSGGKDSCCIKEIANMAGVKYDAHYNATTVDPPELVRFIKYKHPDVEIVKPDLSMRKLIVKRGMMPMRHARYCCAVLKEGGGKGRVVVTGVRWAESNRRRKQHGIARVDKLIMNDDNDDSRRMVEQCYRTQKTMVNPIVDWLDEDVWEFIHERGISYCSLYDEGKEAAGVHRLSDGGKGRAGSRPEAVASV